MGWDLPPRLDEPVIRRAFVILGIVGALLTTAVGPAAAVSASAGGGAELPAIAFQRWCQSIARCTYDVHDASLDTRQLARGTVTWIGVDEELNAAELRETGGPVGYLPVMLGALAVGVHVPGIDGHQLQLSGGVLGGIFSGEITSWRDRRIRRQNLHHPLHRGRTITLCVPAYASGTAYNMSDYLAKASPVFRKRVGAASLRPKWRGQRVIRVADVSKLDACVEQHAGAIGFFPLGDALRLGQVHDIIAVGNPQQVTYGTGANKKTVTKLVYQHPTTDGMVIAGTSASTALKSDLLFDPVDIRVEGAYPITTAVWVAYRSDRKMSAATRSSLTAMLTSSAQSELQGLGFAALPRNVLAAARAALAKAR